MAITEAGPRRAKGNAEHDGPDGEIPLFADREKVYPKSVKGTVRRIKWAVLIACLAIYYLAPWLRWDRGIGRPAQALLIDMPGRRAYFFGIEIWPQEIYFIAGLLILGAVALFAVTSLFGRMWCGYTCPQTVWTDLFLWAERLIEGDRMARIRLDEQPWSLRKLGKKLAKHAIWLVIAALTGGAWIMYFNDAPTVTREIVTLQASTTVYFFAGLFTATTYLLAGWAREQVCTYMCPWPRFQAAMVDEETLTVSYRDWRGEPRGRHHKGEAWDGRGDCVDCRACVAVCPTGIDIRDGLQLECIGCGLCIDACNDIMERIDRPSGLIAFDTYANLAAHRAGGSAVPHFIRPRTVVYAAVLSVLAGLMVWGLLSRSVANMAVLGERSPLYVRIGSGEIRNSFTVKIENMRPDDRSFTLSVPDLPAARLRLEEAGDHYVPAADGEAVVVKGDSVGTFHIHVVAADAGHAETHFTFRARAGDDSSLLRHDATFRGPGH
jgi:cytochrome c oxidase accessory protein FixG